MPTGICLTLAVLKALICSMLHISPEQVKSVEITNPIVLGQHIDNKEYVLDITVLMNDNTPIASPTHAIGRGVFLIYHTIGA